MALEIVPQPEPMEPSRHEEDGGSLADHEAQFKQGATKQVEMGPEDDEDDDEAATERDKTGRFQPRHRAASQQAKPEDVSEIQALTKTLREKEAELAKANPDSVAGSKRLLNLKRQIAAVEAELGTYRPKEQEKVDAKATPSQPATFDEQEPTLDQFADQPDPYLAYTRALGRYDRKKEAFDAAQQGREDGDKAARQAELTAFGARVQAFADAHKDYDTVTGPMQKMNLPPLLVASLIKSDKGPESVYYLAQHQDVLDELVLLTDSKPVNDSLVAMVQRRLSQRVQAANVTGSAAPPQTFIPPRPPNPVRTGPIRTEETLPGDDASLAEHEQAFNKRRRR
jgi:hypothetical protein